MESTMLKKKIQERISTADYDLLKKIDEAIAAFEYQKQQDRMIEEAEEDIKAGRVYSQQEMTEQIRGWKEL
ncbi:hypothetical protein ACH3O9_05345 [Leeuwenhoekiella sp. A16]|uniref:hypothetical protein n=1 Tax=unclassified Leeuwenhoekiella TaxID=2615029 RepID=UPI003A80B063